MLGTKGLNIGIEGKPIVQVQKFSCLCQIRKENACCKTEITSGITVTEKAFQEKLSYHQ